MELNYYSLLADLTLIIHFAFVVFVVAGFLLILAGMLADWSWTSKPAFRNTHLAAIAVVVLQAWFGQHCPLTIWENELRQLAGEIGYDESFVEHWLHKVLFYQAEPWVFTVVYTVFGALVLTAWFVNARRKSRS